MFIDFSGFFITTILAVTGLKFSIFYFCTNTQQLERIGFFYTVFWLAGVYFYYEYKLMLNIFIFPIMPNRRSIAEKLLQVALNTNNSLTYKCYLQISKR